MSGYQAIWRSILDSSIARDYVVRHVFEDLLKLADYRTGEVDMTAEAIARRTNVPPDLIERAISELEKPDRDSRNQAEEGRRIVRLEPERQWGWRIVNYFEYQNAQRLEGNGADKPPIGAGRLAGSSARNAAPRRP